MNFLAKRKTRCRNLYDRYSNEHVKKSCSLMKKTSRWKLFATDRMTRPTVHVKKEFPANHLYHESCHFTKKIMVSAGVSWSGKTYIYFIDTKTTKVNSECCMKLLDEGLLPDCRKMSSNEDYVFQQDGATYQSIRYTGVQTWNDLPEDIYLFIHFI